MKKPPKSNLKEKIESLGTSQILSYQGLIEMSSEAIDQFVTDMHTTAEQKKISQIFYEETREELQTSYDSNQIIMRALNSELERRLRRDFPDVTTESQLKPYHVKARAAMEDYKNLLTDTDNLKDKKTENKVLDLKVDTDRKV